MEHLFFILLIISVACFFLTYVNDKKSEDDHLKYKAPSIDLSKYYPVRLSKYTEIGLIVSPGQHIMDQLDSNHIREVNDSDFEYFSTCSSSMLDEYLILLTYEEFENYSKKQVKKILYGRL